jgi:hypothetical protein
LDAAHVRPVAIQLGEPRVGLRERLHERPRPAQLQKREGVGQRAAVVGADVDEVSRPAGLDQCGNDACLAVLRDVHELGEVA